MGEGNREDLDWYRDRIAQVVWLLEKGIVTEDIRLEACGMLMDLRKYVVKLKYLCDQLDEDNVIQILNVSDLDRR